ncbi:peptidase S41-like protein [Halanaerobium saccharolyticum]|uniref:Peptidase S41-like protein n=1 Tax=Halanaerobium saccharolyticum TaxID=43595 RepID=A0A4R6LPS0_9FIRM|nr:S41 family peptidase [Halanaerobium saccharolyticum]TDO89322.1 peptidase S41-like protein [Halanaerobium saccharolyticum]
MIFSVNQSGFLPVNTIILFALFFVLISLILLFSFILLRRRLQGKRIKIFAAWTIISLLAVLMLYNTGFFGSYIDVEAAKSKKYTREELVQDLKQVETTILDENPLLFVKKEDLKSDFLNTYDLIENGMTELEFYRLINPLITGVNCGHTNLYISEALEKNREENAKFFPLKVTLLNDELFLLEGDRESGIKPGNKIESINGLSSKKIIEELIKNISGDGKGEAKQRYILSKYFNSRFYDFIDNSDQFTVEYLDQEGNKITVNLNAEHNSNFNLNSWSLHFAAYRDGNYYEQKIFDDYALLDLNVFMQEKVEKFDSFLEDFFLNLKEKEVSNLIIDLRGNFGANPFMSKTLLSYLVNKETDYFTADLPFLQRVLGFTDPIKTSENNFEGKIILLTDGANFSTAAHFVAFFKYHELGTILGRRTGGSYVCSDSSKDIVLSNTRMRLHYSTLIYELAVEGLPKNKGIEPDITVKEEISDILNKRDPQLEQALKIIN